MLEFFVYLVAGVGYGLYFDLNLLEAALGGDCDRAGDALEKRRGSGGTGSGADACGWRNAPRPWWR